MSIYHIQKVIERFAPKEGAEPWDNVGVLIDSVSESQDKSIMLCIDFTDDVLEECIAKKVTLVVAYHPVIFAGLKALVDPKYLRCIKHGISVYCPHTQLDPLMNAYILERLEGNTSITKAVAILKDLSGLSCFRIARGKVPPSKILVGVGSAFKNVEFKNTLIVTGEMSHHDLLRCIRNDNTVILMEHSNSERVFLPELARLVKCDAEMDGYSIHISNADKDPIEFI